MTTRPSPQGLTDNVGALWNFGPPVSSFPLLWRLPAIEFKRPYYHITFVRDFVVNTVAASFACPRHLRTLIYRACGYDVRTVRVSQRCRIGGRKLTIGERVFINENCFFDAAAPIVIEDGCFLGPQVMLVTSTHEPGIAYRRAGEAIEKPIRIGQGTWIGARATVLAGVTIGPRCVIAAGAVVASDCEPDLLYAGVPARPKKKLAALDMLSGLPDGCGRKCEPAAQASAALDHRFFQEMIEEDGN